MYKILKSTSKMLAVFSVMALFLGASVNAYAKDRTTIMESKAVPAGISAKEMFGKQVKTDAGEQIASINDVILANDGATNVITDVVLEYNGDLVAVPIQDMKFTSQNGIVYEGTKSNLDAARDRYVYGKAPFVYPRAATRDQRGYYGADVRYGTDIQTDRSTSDNEIVQSGPDSFPSGKDYYGADLFYGPRMPAHPNPEYVENEGHVRGYYDRPYTYDESQREYGFEGHGAELHFGPK